MKSYLTKFKSFPWKIVQMGISQKLQNSIQTLIIFWPVYPIHTNSLFWVIFLELPFCHFPPPNTSIRGKDSKIQLIFHLDILVFQTNGKQPYSFPVLSRFCKGLCMMVSCSDTRVCIVLAGNDKLLYGCKTIRRVTRSVNCNDTRVYLSLCLCC